MTPRMDLDAIRGWWEAVYADGTEFADAEAAQLLAAVPPLCDELQRLRKVADAADALYRYAVAEGAAQLDRWNALADALDVARPLDTPGNEPLDGL